MYAPSAMPASASATNNQIHHVLEPPDPEDAVDGLAAPGRVVDVVEEVAVDVVGDGTTTTTFVDGGLVAGGLVAGGLVAGGLVAGGLVAGGLVAGGWVVGGLVAGGWVVGGLVAGGWVVGGAVGRVGSVGLTPGGPVPSGVLGTVPTVVGTAVDVGAVTAGRLTVGRSPFDDPPDPHAAAARTPTISKLSRRRLIG